MFACTLNFGFVCGLPLLWDSNGFNGLMGGPRYVREVTELFMHQHRFMCYRCSQMAQSSTKETYEMDYWAKYAILQDGCASLIPDQTAAIRGGLPTKEVIL